MVKPWRRNPGDRPPRRALPACGQLARSLRLGVERRLFAAIRRRP
jgi:hypothetical protein